MTEATEGPIDISAVPNAPPPPAGFWLRALAKLADRLVMYFIGGALIMASALLHIAGISGIAAFWFIIASIVLLEVLYFAFFTSSGRQTLGYRLAGIRVETQSQQPAAFSRTFVRAVVLAVSHNTLMILIGVVDYLPAAFGRKRALHDILTGTRVARVARPQMVPLALCVVAFFVFIGLLVTMRGQLLAVRAFFIPSGAMQNTLQIGDSVLVNTLFPNLKKPQVGEVLVFRAPAASGSGGQDFIKRCVGAPGDIIEMKGRQLFRNGKPVQEPFATWEEAPAVPIDRYDMKIVDGKVYSREYMGPGQPGPWLEAPRIYEPNQQRITQAKPEAIPAGKYVMLGDFRNNSNDSHAWGFVPEENFVGKAMFIYWPLNRLQGL